MFPFFTIIHPLVDACSVAVLIAGGMTWERVIAYNAMAFALQMPLGMALDAWPRLVRGGFFLGTGMVFAAAVGAALGLGGCGVLAVACVGNALFHLTAGKHVLEEYGGRSGPIGLFIATGALGLMAGQMWAARAAGVCLWFFAAALGACVVVAAMRGRSSLVAAAAKMAAPHKVATSATLPVLVGLFTLIVWRSWAGLFASGCSAGECALLMLVGAAVTFAGKVVGGYLGDRFGRWRVTVLSCLGSVALVFFCEPTWMLAWFILLFVSQLATAPVLSLVYDRVERKGGTAFGLNCLGLFVGSLA
jgi:FSR family fosmidomycin resistance protein-like MFS transporter